MQKLTKSEIDLLIQSIYFSIEFHASRFSDDDAKTKILEQTKNLLDLLHKLKAATEIHIK